MQLLCNLVMTSTRYANANLFFYKNSSNLWTETVMQTDVTTKYQFFPFSEKSEKLLLYLDVRSVQDNYTMELRDRVTGHDEFGVCCYRRLN